jgi:transposase
MSAPTRPRSRSHRTRSYDALLHKPHGVIHPRVQAVGPEHFAIIAIDPAKARSKWMMTDFYGNVLIPPTELEHHARGFRGAIEAINLQSKPVRSMI